MPQKRRLTVKSATKQFLDVKAKKSLLDRKYEELRDFLKPIVKASPGFVAHKFQFLLDEYSQEHFDLKEAKKALDSETLEKIKAFIDTSIQSRIRTVYVGEEKPK